MLLSFIFDIPIFLPLLGALLWALHLHKHWNFRNWFIFTLAMFWLISGSLYFDLGIKGGNHFMWYSWLDTLGVVKTFPIPTPTYKDFWGFWNLFGFFLFLTYPFILFWGGSLCYKMARRLKGIFFGHIKGQSGLWGLITNK